MRHFPQLTELDRNRLFSVPPDGFNRCADVETIATALGATLYLPGSRPRLVEDLRRLGAGGVLSVVVCLEDAVADRDVSTAQARVIDQLTAFARHCDVSTAPLVFVRVRHPDQISAIVDGLGDSVSVLSGFVLPKFTDVSGGAYLEAIVEASAAGGVRLFGMPVIESTEMIHQETRRESLLAVQAMLTKYRDQVLAVRIGATDLCSAYGIRRGPGMTIYDVRVVSEVITDVVNIFGRADGDGHVVTGGVWEYFTGRDQFKPWSRQPPFEYRNTGASRRDPITSDMEGLLREVVLDKANGLTGKTVIHPSHAPVVHALMVVTAEEYADARDVMRAYRLGGGVQASSYRNKMNEAKPHRAWARRILRRAAIFGVAAEGVDIFDLLVAGVES